jgi:hypothetical protein
MGLYGSEMIEMDSETDVARIRDLSIARVHRTKRSQRTPTANVAIVTGTPTRR